MIYYLTRKNQGKLFNLNNKWMVLERWLITVLSRSWAIMVLTLLGVTCKGGIIEYI